MQVTDRTKTDAARPETSDSGGGYGTPPSQQKEIIPTPPSIPKREESSSSIAKDNMTEKTEIEEPETKDGKNTGKFLNIVFPSIQVFKSAIKPTWGFKKNL